MTREHETGGPRLPADQPTAEAERRGGAWDERRKWSRVRRRLKVTLKHSPCFSVDIGLGGVCVELLRVLSPGVSVEGTIQVKGDELPFAGRVAWAKPGEPYLGLRGRMGLLFTRCAPGIPGR